MMVLRLESLAQFSFRTTSASLIFASGIWWCWAKETLGSSTRIRDRALSQFDMSYRDSRIFALKARIIECEGGRFARAGGGFVRAGGSFARAGGGFARAGGSFDRALGDFASAGGSFARAHEEFARAHGEFARAHEEFARARGEFARARGDFARARREVSRLYGGRDAVVRVSNSKLLEVFVTHA